MDEFAGVELTERVIAALAADRITAPTAVQAAAIPAILAGEPTLMRASTGSGKTLAYLLPILQRLRAPDGRRAVVFAPGTELAMQTLRVANAYKADEVTTGSAVATTSIRRQRERVTRSTRLIVGTPDRLLDLFASGNLKGVHTIVLDELEPILTGPDTETLFELLSRSEPRVQLIVASATLGPRSVAFLERFMPACVRVEPPESALTDDIRHHFIRVPMGRSRDVVLARFLQDNRCRRAIVFVSDPAVASHLYFFLREHGLDPVTVSHDRSKRDRREGLDAFRDGRARVLIVSDAVARGLDVPGVEWVLHYDLPRSAQVYVHRAGRTGRAGAKGCSVALVDERAWSALQAIGKALGLRFLPW